MKKTILVCDDEIYIRILIRKIFESRGFSVIEAADGKAGVAAAEKNRPDLIIMDYEMPVMDGYDAVLKLKDGSETGDIPIVILTGYNLEPDLREALNRETGHFLSKPFVISELLETVSAALGENISAAEDG